MNFELERPETVIKAQERQKGLNWFLEMLVFVLVFFVCTFAQILVTLPGEMLLISTNADYQAAAAAGDLDGMAAALRLLGVLVTAYQNTDGEAAGREWLETEKESYSLLGVIRYSGKVAESTFLFKPIYEYSPCCGAAQDYKKFVTRYTGKAR